MSEAVVVVILGIATYIIVAILVAAAGGQRGRSEAEALTGAVLWPVIVSIGLVLLLGLPLVWAWEWGLRRKP